MGIFKINTPPNYMTSDTDIDKDLEKLTEAFENYKNEMYKINAALYVSDMMIDDMVLEGTIPANKLRVVIKEAKDSWWQRAKSAIKKFVTETLPRFFRWVAEKLGIKKKKVEIVQQEVDKTVKEIKTSKQDTTVNNTPETNNSDKKDNDIPRNDNLQDSQRKSDQNVKNTVKEPQQAPSNQSSNEQNGSTLKLSENNKPVDYSNLDVNIDGGSKYIFNTNMLNTLIREDCSSDGYRYDMKTIMGLRGTRSDETIIKDIDDIDENLYLSKNIDAETQEEWDAQAKALVRWEKKRKQEEGKPMALNPTKGILVQYKDFYQNNSHLPKLINGVETRMKQDINKYISQIDSKIDVPDINVALLQKQNATLNRLLKVIIDRTKTETLLFDEFMNGYITLMLAWQRGANALRKK